MVSHKDKKMSKGITIIAQMSIDKQYNKILTFFVKTAKGIEECK